jgi:hypothetical protein
MYTLGEISPGIRPMQGHGERYNHVRPKNGVKIPFGQSPRMRRYPCESFLDYKEEGYAMEIELPCSNEMNFGASGESYFESFSFSDGTRWRNLHQQ